MNPTAVIALACLVAVASAAPQVTEHPKHSTTPIPILEQSQDGPHPNGSYKYSYSTGNGIKVQETGYLKNPGTPNEAQVAIGSFSYTAPDGVPKKVTYTADENGFRPQGDHIHQEILQALDFLASQQDYDDRGFPIP